MNAEACGLWQSVHCLAFTGLCTKGFLSTSWNSLWHSRQAAPAAPGLSLSFDDWAAAPVGEARARSASRTTGLEIIAAPYFLPVAWQLSHCRPANGACTVSLKNLGSLE